MSNCTNCFSGCVETTSDKCVKYTGSPIKFLDISTGDSLEMVEEAITTYLSTVLTGEGILPAFDTEYICDIVEQFLPNYIPDAPSEELTLVDILTAIIRTLCLLEEEIVIERERIDVIEDDYTVGCISVDEDAGTHDVLQAVILQVCQSVTDITDLHNLYDTCITDSTIAWNIQNYLNGLSVNTKIYSKMIPYVVYPYYPPNGGLSPFDSNGVGVGAWEQVYLCNGYNGLTPDLRGRMLTGVTDMARSTNYDPEVDPFVGGNPNYSFGMTLGDNRITLSEGNLPAHSHFMDPDGIHNHGVYARGKLSGSGKIAAGASDVNLGFEYTEYGPAHIHTIHQTGNNWSHSNIPPVYALYYIMYRPS